MSEFDPLRFLRNKFLKDAATLQVSGMLNQASQFVSSIVIAFLLGARGQGEFTIAVVLQSLFYNVVSIGVVQATISQLASASARGLQGKVAAWMAFLAKMYLVFNTLLIAAGYFALPWIARHWYGDEQLGRWAWWLSLWPLLDTPRAVVFVALQGTRRMLALAKLDNAQELLRMFLVAIGALVTRSPAGAVAGEIVSRILASTVAVELYRRARKDGGPPLPSLREVVRHVPEIPLRQGTPLAFRIGIVKNASTLFLKIFPRLLIGKVGMEWVAYFHVAQRIMDLPMILLQGVSRTILPALSEMRGLRDLERFRKLYVRASLVTGALISAGILLALPLIQPLVRLTFPADYARPVFLYACILALGYVPMSFAVGLESFYIVSEQLKASVLLAVLGCIVTIPVNVLLIRALPETGAAWGLSFYMSWVLVHFAYVGWYFRRARTSGAWS